jgi:hypothetical protein
MVAVVSIEGEDYISEKLFSTYDYGMRCVSGGVSESNFYCAGIGPTSTELIEI